MFLLLSEILLEVSMRQEHAFPSDQNLLRVSADCFPNCVLAVCTPQVSSEVFSSCHGVTIETPWGFVSKVFHDLVNVVQEVFCVNYRDKFNLWSRGDCRLSIQSQFLSNDPRLWLRVWASSTGISIEPISGIPPHIALRVS